MKQYEPCIQNNNNNNNNNKKMIKMIKTKVKKEKGICLDRERACQGVIFIFYFFFFSLLSQIYGNRTVGFHQG